MHTPCNVHTFDAFEITQIPECLQKYVEVTDRPHDIYGVVAGNRAAKAQLLTRRFFNQIQYGCKNPDCTVPTCLTYRKRITVGPVRPHHDVTARALAVRCVERYAHRGRDIDRTPRREKGRKLSSSSQTTFSNEGLCYSEPVVPWYADAREYLAKKEAAAETTNGNHSGVSSTVQSQDRPRRPPLSPTTTSQEETRTSDSTCRVEEPSRTGMSSISADPTSGATNNDSRPVQRPEAPGNSTPGEADSGSRMSARKSPAPSTTIVTQRIDRASFTQSLFNAIPLRTIADPMLRQLPRVLSSPCPTGCSCSGNRSGHGLELNSSDISKKNSPSSLTRGVSFIVLPASAVLYLKMLTLNTYSQYATESTEVSQVQALVNQSLHNVFSDPDRLLFSASTWNQYVHEPRTGTGRPSTSFQDLAEREGKMVTEHNDLAPPNWSAVVSVCRDVLLLDHDQRKRMRVLSHIQRLIKRAYASPSWLPVPLRDINDHELFVPNEKFARLLILVTDITYATNHLLQYSSFSSYSDTRIQCDCFPFQQSHLTISQKILKWSRLPEVESVAINLAGLLSHRIALDSVWTVRSDHLYKTAAPRVVQSVTTWLKGLGNLHNECVLHQTKHATRLGHVLRLLEMMTMVIFANWDRSPIIPRSGPVAGALQMIRGLYRIMKHVDLTPESFIMTFIDDALENLDMPLEWLHFKADSEKMHILQFPFILPDLTLVRCFRSINLRTMKQSYEEATGMYNNGKAQLLFGKWQVNNVREVLEKIRPHMARYFVMTVRRDHLLEDAIGQIWRRERQELTRPLKVRLGEEDGEVGLDYGGVQQELFRIMFAEAFNANYGMFIEDDKTRTVWFKPDSLEPPYKYEALGILVSLAVYNGIIVPINMPIALYRMILGLKVKAVEHIEDAWPELARSLTQLLDWTDGDVGDVICRTYEFSFENLGQVINIDMSRQSKDNSSSDQSVTSNHQDEAPLVTNSNRKAFVVDYITHLTYTTVAPQLQAFLKGFRTLLSQHALSLLPPEKLKILIEGCPNSSPLNVHEWETNASYEDYTLDDPVITWFWQILRVDFSQIQLRKLLEFVTASDRIPIGGWAGVTFIIQRNAAGNEWLPASSTCYGRLFLPEYSTKAILKEKLEKAIETSTGFGMV